MEGDWVDKKCSVNFRVRLDKIHKASMDCDPVEETYIAQGTPEVTADTDTDMDGSTEALHLDRSSNGTEWTASLTRWDSRDRIREETRIVILDFLSSLPADKLTARNLIRSGNRPERLEKTMCRLSKSSSDAGSYEHKRQKFLRMARLRRKLSLNLKRDIESFDQKKLKHRSKQKEE